MIKKLSDYQRLAVTTAKYPRKFKIIYPTLEMVDEVQEFAAAQGHSNEVKGIGMCFLPFANLINDLELDIESIYEDAIDSLKEVLYDDISEAMEMMTITSAKICGIVKKWLMDEDDELPSDEKVMDIEFSLISYLAAMLFMCDGLNVKWQDVVQININSLKRV